MQSNDKRIFAAQMRVVGKSISLLRHIRKGVIIRRNNIASDLCDTAIGWQ